MRRVISSYILSPETKAFILFQQHKCTEKADQTAENVTLGHPCCKNSADVLGRGTQALPHSHAFGCSIAVKLAGLWHWVAVHRESFWCSEMAILHPCPPREAGAQVPNRCTVWPWHCGDCCCPPTLGTRNQQVHQLLPHQPHCRETNEPQGKCGFSPLKKTFPAATSLEPVLLSQLSRPSAGATQWSSFDFVHPRSRRVFLKWHCSRLQ